MNVAPLLFSNSEAVGLKKAADLAGCSIDTVKRLAKEHKIFRQRGPHHPIEVSVPALLMVCHHDFEALTLLREGRRDDWRVSRYFEFVGIPQ